MEYEHAKIKEKLRSKSQERDKKINNAHQMTEEQLELKRIDLTREEPLGRKKSERNPRFLEKGSRVQET